MSHLALRKIVQHFQKDRGRLLDILWEAQKLRGFLDSSDLSVLADELACAVADIEEVQSFYHFLKSKASGRHQIYLDTSIISQFAGLSEIRQAFETALGIKVGEVSADGEFGLFETSCIGMSDQAPAALIDLIPFPNLQIQEIPHILERLKKGENATDVAKPVQSHLQKMGPFFDPAKNYPSAEANFLKHSAQEIISLVKSSGLRGRGGAGFTTGAKWEACAKFSATKKFVICNADEGEPGTFKDRILLTHFCQSVLEGMLIAAKAVAATEAILYLRAEYTYLAGHIENEFQNISGSKMAEGIQLSLRLGAGAYVCGEESALLESLEGKRGEPRLRPPFPVEKGYLGFPTVVNNVESFAMAARILTEGAESFFALGTAQSKGTRLLSISGDIARPGIYEVPWGITIQEILELSGAITPAILQVGGPSGTCISAADTQRKIAFEDLATGGSLMVFSKERDLFAILDNFMEFFVRESCGNCTPCRAGNVFLRQLLQKFLAGEARPEDLERIRDWSAIVSRTSRCGLGVSSPNVLTTSLKAFPLEFQKRMAKNADPQFQNFDLAKATRDYEDLMKGAPN